MLPSLAVGEVVILGLVLERADRNHFEHRAIVLQPPQKSTLAEWFTTPRGEYVLSWERGQLAAAVDDVFGFCALQVGLPEIDFLAENRIPFRFRAGVEPGCEVRADPVHLPIASASIDLVVLPHVLEFSENPHQILREAERVLMRVQPKSQTRRLKGTSTTSAPFSTCSVAA